MQKMVAILLLSFFTNSFSSDESLTKKSKLTLTNQSDLVYSDKYCGSKFERKASEWISDNINIDNEMFKEYMTAFLSLPLRSLKDIASYHEKNRNLNALKILKMTCGLSKAKEFKSLRAKINCTIALITTRTSPRKSASPKKSLEFMPDATSSPKKSELVLAMEKASADKIAELFSDGK